MIEEMIARLPDAWRELATLLMAPVAWIPRLQQTLLAFFLDASSPWAAAARYVFLLLPALLAVAAVWCTQLSLYTLPFRSSRGRLVSILLLAWWDMARMVWMYWVGLVRLCGVLVGWVLSLAYLGVRLAASVVGQVVGAPLAMT